METDYMKSSNTDIEDGELSGSDESYTPLQRPEELAKVEAKFVPNVTPMEELSEQDDLTNCSSGDTSDSDNNTLKIKRKKTKAIRMKPIEMLQKTAHLQQNHPQSSKTNKAKYNIWTQSLQEDTLLENMRGCDVTNEDKRCDRAVESYDYNIVYRMNGESSINNKLKRRLSNSDDSDNHTHFANKRFRAHKRSGYKGVKSRLGLRSDDSGSNDSNCNNSPRYILDLKDSVESTDEDIAKEIANKLCEQKDELMIRVVDVIGKDIPIKLFKETQEIEINGGMLIMNGMRRRTPGGVFLYLLKNSEEVSQDDKKRIFHEDSRQSVKERKLSQALKREKKVEELKRSLSRNEKELAVIPTRKELIMSHLKPETAHTLSNPPPSPSDGNRENSPDYDVHHVNVTSPEKPILNKEETANGYNDDFLDMHCDDMDMF